MSSPACTALESPDYVRTSLAGAITLGVERGKFAHGARCTCLNLLLTYPRGCAARCSYCGLGGGRNGGHEGTFIRVPWPIHQLDDLLGRAADGAGFARVCVSMIDHPRALADTCAVVARCRERLPLPVSALVAPSVLSGPEDLRALRTAGVDRLGIAVDAATEALFERHRGGGVGGPHRWSRYWAEVDEAAEVFGPDNVGIHLVVGLGETEWEMVEIFLMAQDIGVHVHLFSFYPEAGTPLEVHPVPSLGRYRRMQLARFLIAAGSATRRSFEYSTEGRVTDLGVEPATVPHVERAFMTAGCPGSDGTVACNRPYGNERPSGPLRNYPFTPPDVATLLAELELSLA